MSSVLNAELDNSFLSFLEKISGDQIIDHLHIPLQVTLLIKSIFLLQDIQIHLLQFQWYKLALVFLFIFFFLFAFIIPLFV